MTKHVVSTPLSSIAAGEHVRLATIHGGRQLRARLAELGLTPGAMVTIVANAGRGPLIVGIKNCRMVFGRGMAHQIAVEHVKGRLCAEEPA